MLLCDACGAPIPSGAKLCRGCGKEVASVVVPRPEEQTASYDKTIRVAPAAIKTKTPLKPSAIDLKPAVCYSTPESNSPLALFLSFSSVVVAGTRTKIWGRVQNRTGQLVQDIEVCLQSHGLENSLIARIAQIDPNQIVPVMFDNVMPVTAGVFALQCSLEFRFLKSRDKLVGARTLWINAIPKLSSPTGGIPTERFAVNSDAGIIPDALATPKLLSEEPGTFKLESERQTMEDLVKFRLEEVYQTVPLSYPPSIPESFLTSVETGAVLKLTPGDNSSAGFHLVGRNEFKIGRARQDARVENWSDLVVWFLPRNGDNDRRTKALGRLQVIGERVDDRVVFKNFKPELESYLDQRALGGDSVPFDARTGALSLMDYILDVTRHKGFEGDKLVIRNLEAWKGKHEEQPLIRGCVSFRPEGRLLPFHDAIWIFTSATFGSDQRVNPIVLPNAAPVQGCFYYGFGCFWLQNLVKNGHVLINAKPALPNQIFPLSSRDHLTFGDIDYNVEVSQV